MTAPTLADYLNLSQSIYTLGGAPTPPPGWTLLISNGQPLFQSNTNGMQAAAFTNGSVVVIAYEGMNWSSSIISGQVSDAKSIFVGSVPVSNTTALGFAQTVAAAAGAMPVYVTGHSLGGEEAEFIQQQSDSGGAGISISGGTVFAAPGVPGLIVSDNNPNFISYAERGDVIANWFTSVGTVGQPAKYFGSAIDAAAEIALVLSVTPYGLAAAAGLSLNDHSLQTYANDLGVTLTSPNAMSNASADILQLGSINGTSLFGTSTASQIVNGNLVLNGDTLTPISANGVESLTLSNGQVVDVVLNGSASINIPAIGGIAVIDAVSGNPAAGEMLTNGTGGTISFTDELGDQIASYSSSQVAGGSIKINGGEIDAYNASNQLINSTQEVSLGGGVNGVLDHSWNTAAAGITSASAAGQNYSWLQLKDDGTGIIWSNLVGLFYYQNATATPITIPQFDPNISGLPLTDDKSDIFFSTSDGSSWEYSGGTSSYSGGTTSALLTPSGAAYYVVAVSPDGTYVLGITKGSANNSYYVRHNGVFTNITLPSYTNSSGHIGNFIDGGAGITGLAINDSGIIAGSIIFQSNANDPSVGGMYNYQTGALSVISDPSGIHGTAINAINDSGEVAGDYLDSSSAMHAFTYSGGVYTDITIPGVSVFESSALNFSRLFASGLKNDGSVVVVHTQAGSTNGSYSFIVGLGSTAETSTLEIANSGTIDLTIQPQLAFGTINLAAGNNNVTVGAATQTINGTSGNNTFNVTSATIGAMVNGGSGNNALNISGGGTAAMGSNITGVQTVGLQSAATAYNFTANNLAGLVITDNSASNDTIIAGNGGDTIVAGAGNDTLDGGNANNIYQFGTSFGQDTINNAFGGSTTAKGQINFVSGLTFENLWFTQTGSNLIIRVLGSSNTVTITGWFGSNAGAQVQSLTAAGLTLSNSKVATLVSAMATYQTAHSSFNPATATVMPTDATLQSSMAVAWGKYDSVTVNSDGSWSGNLADHVGGNWSSIYDSYTSTSQLSYEYEAFNDGSYEQIWFNTGTGTWVKTVEFDSATNVVLQDDEYYSDGSEILTPGSASVTMNGGTGYNTYSMPTTIGQDVINNGGGTAAHGEIDFATGVTNQKLWLTQSGNDLVIRQLGTSQTITIAGWFSGTAGNEIQLIKTTDGLNLSPAAVTQLVNAMAVYQAAHSTFNAATATTMPTDTTLQTAISNSWHGITTQTGVTVAYAQANQTTVDTTAGGYVIADTSTNVLAGMTFLNSDVGHIASIQLTDSTTPTLALTTTQYTGDTTVLGKITSAYNISVSGVTSANAPSVAGNTHVTSLAVSDTAANVITNIAALQTLATGTKLLSIALTDSTTPTLALSAAQDSADAAVLGKITSAYNLTVSGVTAANAANVAGQTHFVSETISDTAANFVTNLTSLETLAAANKVTSIAFTDSTTPTITLTAAQQTADADALAKITSAYNLVITGGTVTAAVAATATSAVSVSDTSANVLTYLSQLQTQAAAGRITSISFTDSATPTLPLTAAQLTADATVLGKISSAYNLSISGVTAANAATVAGQAHVTTITVSDTAANVLTNITALQTLATGTKLSSIALTDGTTPTLALTSAQYSADTAALGKITSAYNLTVSGVTAASAATVAANTHITSLTVSDTGANFVANVATLQTLATGTKLASIVLTDSTTPTLSLTSAQYSADTAALGKISSAYNLSISGVTAANAATIAAAARVTSIIVSDTAANVLTNIVALETLAVGTKLASITLTDSATPTLALTSAQDASDSAVLGKITSAYNLMVSGVTAANATSVSGQAHFASETVSDTAANFVSNISSLQTLAAANKVTSIAFMDSTTPTITLTAAQQTADAAALAKITSAYNLVITGGSSVTAAVAATATSVVSVSDTAANVLTYLSQLQTQAAVGRITSIAFTDSTAPTLSLTVAQLTADATVLGKITSQYKLTVTGGGTEVLPAGVAAKTITLQSASSVYNFTANSTPGVTIIDNGANGNDTITAIAGDTISIGGNGQFGNGVNVTISSGTVNLANNARADVFGGSNTINVGQNDLLGVQNGNNNTITAGTGTSIYVNSGNGDVVNATAGGVDVITAASVSVSVVGGNNSVEAANGDTVNVSGNGQFGNSDFITISSGTVNVAANARADIYGGSDTITAGASTLLGVQSGDANTINLGSSSVLYLNSGTNDVINGGGSEQYNFTSTFGKETINNGTGSAANGSVIFASGITDENLWFIQSGNDLLIDHLGTSTGQIKIASWFGASAGAKLQSLSANGLTLDTQVAQLVNAMATYQTAHSSFNPTTATAMPTDTTLQGVIAAAWHA